MWAMFQSPQITTSRPDWRNCSRCGRKRSIKLNLTACRLLRTRAGGQIDRNHRQIAEDHLDVAAFGVNVGNAQSLDDLVGLASAIDANAAVAFFLGVMEVAVMARRIEHGRAHVANLGLELLHADEIGILLLQP